MTRRPASANGIQGIPEATVARLPVYLRALYALADRGIATVSSEELAVAAGVNSAKLRKDLSHLGSYGTRGVGYDVEYLVYQVSRELGLTQDWPVLIVGAGNLGRALANYGGFASRGFRIAALLDSDPEVVGSEIGRHVVRHSDDIELVAARDGVSIGVIATPAAAAQGGGARRGARRRGARRRRRCARRAPRGGGAGLGARDGGGVGKDHHPPG